MKTTPITSSPNLYDAHIKVLQPDATDEDTQKEILAHLESAVDPQTTADGYSNYVDPTKTDRTAAEYVEKAARLLRKAQRELKLGSLNGQDLLMAVGHIITSKTTKTKATWRYYKAALLHYLENEMDPDDPSVDAASVALLQTTTEGCKAAYTGEGSSKKKKSIPKQDLEKLIAAANQARTRKGEDGLSKQAVEWLIAATVTGLRPVEWRLVEIDHSAHPEQENPLRRHRLRFVVHNAKATNGRAHGPTRRFLVSTDEETKDIVFRVYERTTAFNEASFNVYLSNCRQALRRLCRRIWPRAESKNYTLYTGRHQFSANQKASGKSRKEVSYLMGHKVTKTAIMSYGKKRVGWAASPDDMDIAPDDPDFELRVIDDAKPFSPNTTPASSKNKPGPTQK